MVKTSCFHNTSHGCYDVFSPNPPFFLCVCISVFPTLERIGQQVLSSVGWDLINEAAQSVISAIITSLIQLLLSVSPGPMLLSLFPNRTHLSLCLRHFFNLNNFHFFSLFSLRIFLLPNLSPLFITCEDLKPNE